VTNGSPIPVRGAGVVRVAPVLATAVAIALTTLALLAGARRALNAAQVLRSRWPREADTLILPPARLVRFLSLDHPEMAADLIAARANVYFGGQIASHGEQAWLARALNLAVDLDPSFQRLYLRGAAMLVYNGREITVDTLLDADRLLARGAREFPGDWELPFQRGFNLLFELPRVVGQDDPRALEWRQQGVESLRQATLLDGVPPWLPNLAARMLTRQGGEELALRHLERTFEITSDPATRLEIGRKLSELHHQRLAAELATGAAALEAELAARYPYAPEAFSLILGPRVAPGVDLGVLLLRNSPPTMSSPP